MKRIIASITAFLSVCAIASAQNAKVIDSIVAHVNSDIILQSELEKAKAELRRDLTQQGLQGAELERAFDEQSKRLLADLIDRSLLLQVAKERGLTAEVEVVKEMDEMRQQNKLRTMEELEAAIVKQGYTVEEIKDIIRTRHLTQQVLRGEVYSRVNVTTEEARNYYEANKKEFDQPAGVRIQEIVVYTANKTPEEVAEQRKKIEEALAAVKRGDDFEEVAEKYSEAESAQRGGDLGFARREDLNKETQDAIAGLEKGQVTDILSIGDGLFILKLADSHAGGILSFELAKDEIENILFSQRVPPKIREYLTKLRTEGFVTVREGYEDLGAPPSASKN